MAIPSTGKTMAGAGYLDKDPRKLERGKPMAAFIRDNRGAFTNISPHNSDGSVNWGPIATDGALRDDLGLFKKVNGEYVLNPDPNEGYIRFVSFKEGDGPEMDRSTDTDELMIEQDDEVYDSVTVKEDETFTFSSVETLDDAWRRLRDNLPFSDANGNNLVQLPGTTPLGWGQAVGAELVDRQVLLVREFAKPGGVKAYTVKAYSLCRRTKVDKIKMGKKDAETATFTFRALPDPYFMGVIDGVYQPIKGRYEWASTKGVWQSPVSQYTVGVGATSAGTFTLSYGGVGPSTAIAFNANSSAVKSALVGLDDGYVTADWSVTGSAPTWTVTVPNTGKVLTGDGTGLTGGALTITPV